MSAATITPARGRPSGATSLTDTHRTHRLGDALRAIRVYTRAAFDVVILGDYDERAGVRRR
ncbi:hypothetical protein ACIPSE_36880 [Streptomyces sp. NPDC090106]|uniref:hypothetical protein n=1 Tax=Streptomyces sp. NPDC090106 TaxID=3365946 RepID=UPI00381A08D4